MRGSTRPLGLSRPCPINVAVELAQRRAMWGCWFSLGVPKANRPVSSFWVSRPPIQNEPFKTNHLKRTGHRPSRMRDSRSSNDRFQPIDHDRATTKSGRQQTDAAPRFSAVRIELRWPFRRMVVRIPVRCEPNGATSAKLKVAHGGGKQRHHGCRIST